MAMRASGKAKTRPTKPSGPAASRKKVAGTKAKVAVAGGDDVERLRAELEAAQRRIAELEAQRAALADRIDWVIDSLHSLLDE